MTGLAEFYRSACSVPAVPGWFSGEFAAAYIKATVNVLRFRDDGGFVDLVAQLAVEGSLPFVRKQAARK